MHVHKTSTNVNDRHCCCICGRFEQESQRKTMSLNTNRTCAYMRNEENVMSSGRIVHYTMWLITIHKLASLE